MEKEKLIKKWLDNELSESELIEFQNLKEYNALIKLSERAKLFKAPNFDVDKALPELQDAMQQRGVPKTFLNRIKPVGRVAAVVVLGIFVFNLFFNNGQKEYATNMAMKEQVVLPDESTVHLNALSTLSFNLDTWEDKREVKLVGEAFFKVAKGSKFDVNTPIGVVSVIGTEFNVKHREEVLEVVCFEGIVSVSIADSSTTLKAGSSLRLVNGDILNGITADSQPSWIMGLSSFSSVPFTEVLSEFERQYDVKIAGDFDAQMIFTGSFVHNDMELAIKAITLPLLLNYDINNKQIKLYY